MFVKSNPTCPVDEIHEEPKFDGKVTPETEPTEPVTEPTDPDVLNVWLVARVNPSCPRPAM